MTASVFDQKIFRPANQMYYFQLVPRLLTIKDPSLLKDAQSPNPQFRLKVTKGLQLCDEMKKSISVKAINGKAGFDKAHLNFNLPSFNPNRTIQFALVLLKQLPGGEEEAVGQHIIIPNTFIVQFKSSKTRYFPHEVSLDGSYSLKFDLYIDSSRFGLEKLIKETSDQKKEEKRQNIFVEVKPSTNQLPSNQARSQMLSDSQKIQVVTHEGRFMSPNRKIVRKQSDSRKILRRQSSPTRSQDQTSSKKGLRFLSRNTPREENTSQKIQSLAQEQAKKLSQRIRQQQEKRLKSIKQKQMADSQKKTIEDKKRKYDEQLKFAEENSKAQQKRLTQKLKDQEIKRKADEDSIRNIQRERREELEAIKNTVVSHNKTQRKTSDERINKDEETRKSAQEKRMQMQEKQQNVGMPFSRKEQKQLGKDRQIQRTNKEIEKNQPEKDNGKKWTNTKVEVKQDESKQKKLTLNPQEGMTEQVQEGRQIQESIMVRVKTEESHYLEKYLFEAKPIVDSKKWSQPIKIRKTGSQLFDKKGNLVNETSLEKGDRGALDTRSKIMWVIFVIVSILLLYSAITPSRKRR